MRQQNEGPTLYALLMDRATTEGDDRLRAEMRGYLTSAADGIAPVFGNALREAYMTGVREGFAQGVAAASEDKETT